MQVCNNIGMHASIDVNKQYTLCRGHGVRLKVGELGLGICTSSVNFYVFDKGKNNTVRKRGGRGGGGITPQPLPLSSPCFEWAKFQLEFFIPIRSCTVQWWCAKIIHLPLHTHTHTHTLPQRFMFSSWGETSKIALVCLLGKSCGDLLSQEQYFVFWPL